MKHPPRLSMLLLATMFTAGCDGTTDVDPVTLADLVGSWTATSVNYTNQANSAQTFDIIANGGEVRTTVLDGGRSRTWVTFGTFSDEWDAQLAIEGNTLTSTPAEASRGVNTFALVLEGNVLTLTNVDEIFDFTLSGATEVAATEVAILQRQ